jgi:hypothetical protein
MKSKRLQLEGGCKHKLKLNGVALLEQAEQSPPSTPDEAISILKELGFKITSVPYSGATLITPKGEFIEISDYYFYGVTPGSIQFSDRFIHSDLELLLFGAGYSIVNSEAMIEQLSGVPTLERLGFIRANLNEEYLCLYKAIRPTTAQYNAIRQLLAIRELSRRRHITINTGVDISLSYEQEFQSLRVTYNPRSHEDIEFIISIIKQFYRTGVLGEVTYMESKKGLLEQDELDITRIPQTPVQTPEEAIAVLKAYYPFLPEKDPDSIEFDSANTIEIIKDFYSTGKLRLHDYMIKETAAITTKNKKKPKTKEAYNMIKEARLSEGLTIEDIATLHSVPVKQIEEQLAKGIEVEYEHTDDTSEAARIAMDHLVEIPDYYDRLEKMEKSYKTKTEAQAVHITQEYSLEERLNDITDNIKKLEQEIANAIERNDFKTYASKVALKNDLVREKMQLKNKLTALKQLKIGRGIKEATEEGESMNKKIINENRYYSADEAYDILVEYEIATEDEINLVCNIIGYNIETMEDILYVRTGYRSFDQLLGEDEDDDYFDED